MLALWPTPFAISWHFLGAENAEVQNEKCEQGREKVRERMSNRQNEAARKIKRVKNWRGQTYEFRFCKHFFSCVCHHIIQFWCVSIDTIAPLNQLKYILFFRFIASINFHTQQRTTKKTGRWTEIENTREW